jgi:hypothetical protein
LLAPKESNINEYQTRRQYLFDIWPDRKTDTFVDHLLKVFYYFFFAGDDLSAGHVTARAGTNITIACPGVTPTSYVYLVEWVCLGCKCTKCPNPNGEGKRLLR